jgi:hypothetical protein
LRRVLSREFSIPRPRWAGRNVACIGRAEGPGNGFPAFRNGFRTPSRPIVACRGR